MLKNIYKVIVTAGPTEESIDPVRFISNRSSGKQGYAIAEELFLLGFEVYLVSGKVDSVIRNSVSDGINVIDVVGSNDMLRVCQDFLPFDVFISNAAVCDWSPCFSSSKIKKKDNQEFIELKLNKNTDILSYISNHKKLRPSLVVGFAAETENLIENAKSKLITKNCDYILANFISSEKSVFNSDYNKVTLVSKDDIEEWDLISKREVAKKLALLIKKKLNAN